MAAPSPVLRRLRDDDCLEELTAALHAAYAPLAEERARLLGADEVALDTAEPASELIALYTRRGYRHVGHADWRPTTNYRSVVLSKRL